MSNDLPQPTIDSEVDQILDDIPGDWQIIFEAKENAHTAITNLIAQEANKAEIKGRIEEIQLLIGTHNNDSSVNQYEVIKVTRDLLNERIQALTADKEQA